jgi:hypothetical protein
VAHGGSESLRAVQPRADTCLSRNPYFRPSLPSPPYFHPPGALPAEGSKRVGAGAAPSKGGRAGGRTRSRATRSSGREGDTRGERRNGSLGRSAAVGAVGNAPSTAVAAAAAVAVACMLVAAAVVDVRGCVEAAGEGRAPAAGCNGGGAAGAGLRTHPLALPPSLPPWTPPFPTERRWWRCRLWEGRREGGVEGGKGIGGERVVRLG